MLCLLLLMWLMYPFLSRFSFSVFQICGLLSLMSLFQTCGCSCFCCLCCLFFWFILLYSTWVICCFGMCFWNFPPLTIVGISCSRWYEFFVLYSVNFLVMMLMFKICAFFYDIPENFYHSWIHLCGFFLIYFFACCTLFWYLKLTLYFSLCDNFVSVVVHVCCSLLCVFCWFLCFLTSV